MNAQKPSLLRTCWSAEHSEALAATMPNLAAALAAPGVAAAAAAAENGHCSGSHAEENGVSRATQPVGQPQDAAALHLEALHVLALLLPAPLPEVGDDAPLLPPRPCPACKISLTDAALLQRLQPDCSLQVLSQLSRAVASSAGCAQAECAIWSSHSAVT